jgi:hypothetical protein
VTHLLAYLIFALHGFNEPHHDLNQNAREMCGPACPVGYIWYSSDWWSEIGADPAMQRYGQRQYDLALKRSSGHAWRECTTSDHLGCRNPPT